MRLRGQEPRRAAGGRLGSRPLVPAGVGVDPRVPPLGGPRGGGSRRRVRSRDHGDVGPAGGQLVEPPLERGGLVAAQGARHEDPVRVGRRLPGLRVEQLGDVRGKPALDRGVDRGAELAPVLDPEVDDGDGVAPGEADGEAGAAAAGSVRRPAQHDVRGRGRPGLGAEDLVDVPQHELLRAVGERMPGRVALPGPVAVAGAVAADAGRAAGGPAVEPVPREPDLPRSSRAPGAVLERAVGAGRGARAQRPAPAGHRFRDPLHPVEDVLGRAPRTDAGVDAAGGRRLARGRRSALGRSPRLAQPGLGALGGGQDPRPSHAGDHGGGLRLARQRPGAVELVAEGVVLAEAVDDPDPPPRDRAPGPEPVVERRAGLRRPAASLVLEGGQRPVPPALPVAAFRGVAGVAPGRVGSAAVALRGLVHGLDRPPPRVAGGGQVHRAQLAAERVAAAARYLEAAARGGTAARDVEGRPWGRLEPGCHGRPAVFGHAISLHTGTRRSRSRRGPARARCRASSSSRAGPRRCSGATRRVSSGACGRPARPAGGIVPARAIAPTPSRAHR